MCAQPLVDSQCRPMLSTTQLGGCSILQHSTCRRERERPHSHSHQYTLIATMGLLHQGSLSELWKRSEYT